MSIPFQAGQFVWSRFPFHERPNDPGPIDHVAYIARVVTIHGRPHATAVSIYTTTRQVRAGEAVPIGLIPVPEDLARRKNQKRGKPPFPSPSASRRRFFRSCAWR